MIIPTGPAYPVGSTPVVTIGWYPTCGAIVGPAGCGKVTTSLRLIWPGDGRETWLSVCPEHTEGQLTW